MVHHFKVDFNASSTLPRSMFQRQQSTQLRHAMSSSFTSSSKGPSVIDGTARVVVKEYIYSMLQLSNRRLLQPLPHPAQGVYQNAGIPVPNDLSGPLPTLSSNSFFDRFSSSLDIFRSALYFLVSVAWLQYQQTF